MVCLLYQRRTSCGVPRLASLMKMFDSTAGLGKEAAVFFLLVWRWVKVENAVSLSLENACTNIRSCGKWYAYYYLLLPPTAECQLPLSFPEPPFYSKEVFVCNKMALTFAWLVEIKSMTLLPYPCSHFYFDINFGDRLYSKEKRSA